ncbi:hypothetical protein IWX64_001446 [Arthrobacter sp. CAN_A212]|uniref:hypothetical protein n=1 Tax=Arthrobacter sp. CAN_A212 TaxID=2787719 RepID=UPI0018CAC069
MLLAKYDGINEEFRAAMLDLVHQASPTVADAIEAIATAGLDTGPIKELRRICEAA